MLTWLDQWFARIEQHATWALRAGVLGGLLALGFILGILVRGWLSG